MPLQRVFTGYFAAVILCTAPLATAGPDVESASDTKRWRTYEIQTRLIQVHGIPDWAFWTQPYARPHEFVEGAGRVFGPVDITDVVPEFTHDARHFAYPGFPEVSEGDAVLLGSYRGSNLVDRRAIMRDMQYPTLFKVILTSGTRNAANTGNGISTDVSGALDRMYAALAPTPRELEKTDVEAKTIILDPDGMMMFLEANTAATPGVARVDQYIVTRLNGMMRSKGGWKSGNEEVRCAFSCSYDVPDGATLAFLVPQADSDYLLVVSTFSTVPAPEAHSNQMLMRRPHIMAMKTVVVDGEPDWDAMRAMSPPEEFRRNDGEPVVFTPRNPDAFWNMEKMTDEPQRFYFKSLASHEDLSYRVGGVDFDRHRQTKAHWKTVAERISPAGYRLPFSDDELDDTMILFDSLSEGTAAPGLAPGEGIGVFAGFYPRYTKKVFATPSTIDEVIQIRLPIPGADGHAFYARSAMSYEPRDKEVVVRFYPMGGTRYVMVMTRFTVPEPNQRRSL